MNVLWRILLIFTATMYLTGCLQEAVPESTTLISDSGKIHIALDAPAATPSNLSNSPNFRISNTAPSSMIYLYDNATCNPGTHLNYVSSSGGTVYISHAGPPMNSTPLGDGEERSYYAKQIDSNLVESNCAGPATFKFDATNAGIVSFNLTSTPNVGAYPIFSGTDSSPNFQAVVSENNGTIYFYDQSGCIPPARSVVPVSSANVSVSGPLQASMSTVTYSVEHIDQAGNSSGCFSDNIQYLYDNVGPVLTVTSPTGGSAVGPSIVLSGTCEGLGSITITGAIAAPINGVLCNVGVSFSQAVVLTGSGNRTLTISQADSLGNVGSQNVTYNVDNTGPALTVAPANNATVGLSSTISGVCESSGSNVTITSAAVVGSPVTAICSGSAYSQSVVFSAGAAQSISVSQADSLGNTTNVNRNYTVDNVGPALTVVPAESATVGLTANISGACEMGGSNFQISGANVSGSPVNVSCASSSYAQVITFLGGGSQSFTVSQQDVFGNSSSITRTLTVDNSGPTLTVLPAESSTVGATLTISGACETSGTNFRVVGSITGSPVSLSCVGSAYSQSISFTAGGPQAITISQQDVYLNTSSVVRNLTVDNLAPNITVLPAQNTVVGLNAVISGACETSGANFTIAGANVTGSPVNVSCAASAYSQAILFSAGGAQTISVSQEDAVGNTTTVTRILNVDNVGPTLTVLPVENATVGLTATISGACETGGPNFRVSGANLSGSPVILSCAASAYSQSITFMTGGAQAITVTQEDSFGNSTSVTRNLNIDNVGPTLTVLPVENATIGLTATISGACETGGPNFRVSGANLSGSPVILSCAASAYSQSITFLTGGAQAITVSQEDSFGNSTSVTRNLNIDNVGPTLTVLPAENTTVGLTAIINGACENGGSNFRVMGPIVGSPVSLTCSASLYSQSITFTAGGSQVIVVSQEDSFTNTSTVNRTFNVDNVGPTLTVIPIEGATVGLTETVSGVCESSGSNVSIDGLNVNGAPVIATCSGGTYSQSITFLLDGAQLINVSQQDSLSNNSTVPRNYIVDGAAPNLTVTPVDGSTVGLSAVITGNCEDGGSNVSISGSITGSPLFATCSSGNYSQLVTFIGVGMRSITVSQSDPESNLASVPVSYNVDGTGPTLTVSPVESTTVGTSVVINGSCETGGVNFRAIGANIVGSPVTLTCAASAYSQSITFLAGGPQSVVISQEDIYANLSTVTRTLNVDNSAPNLTVIPSENSTVSLTSSISGVCETGGPNFRVSGTNLLGSPVTLSCVGSAYSQSITFTASGTQSIVVSQEDTFGNSSSVTRQLDVSLASLSISEISPYDFGTVVNGTSAEHSFTIINNGSTSATSMIGLGLVAPYEYKGGGYPGTGGNCGLSLASGNNCTIVVLFSPTVVGSATDTIQIDYNNGLSVVSATRDVSGTGQDPANLTISDGAVYNFGNHVNGTSVDYTFNINNSGDATATAMSGTGLSAPFEYVGGSYPGGGTCAATLSSGANCTIVVRFSPTATGMSSDSIQIDYNNGVGGVSANRDVTGTGMNPANLFISDGINYNFGTIAIGNFATHSFNITNSGDVPATGMNSSSLTAPFSFMGGSYPGGGTCGVTLNAGDTCSVQVRFDPTSATYENDTITVNYNDGASGQFAYRDVSGTGAQPADLVISAGPTYDFGTRAIGSISEFSFTVTNTGGLSATSINGYGLSAPFEFKGGTFPGAGGDCSGSLDSGFNCTIVVTYSPATTVFSSSAIQLDYYDGVNTINKNRDVTGTGENPANIAISETGTYNFGSTTVFTSLEHTFTLNNSGGVAATSMSGVGLAAPYEYKGGGYPGTGGNCGPSLGAGGNCNIVVRFTPTVVGSTSDAIQIDYNNGVNSTNATRDVTGTGTAAIPPYTWIGNSGVDQAWSRPENWSTNVVPNGSQVAIFDDNCVGANCNVTINAGTSVGGINIQSSYSGTITMMHTLSISTSGLSMAAGTITTNGFALSNTSTTSITGGTLNIAGGTIYAATGAISVSSSGLLSLDSSNINLTGSLTLGGPSNLISTGNSWVNLVGSSAATVNVGNAVFENIRFNKNPTYNVTVSGSITLNNLQLTCNTGTAQTINSGIFNIKGDINTDGSGANCSANTSMFNINGTSNQTITSSSVSSYRFANVNVNSTTGTVTFSGPINIRNNFIYTSGTVAFALGSQIRLIASAGGDAGQLYSFGTPFKSLYIQKLGGAVTLNSNIEVEGDFATAGNGPINGTYDLTVGGNVTIAGTITGSQANLIMQGAANTIQSAPNLPFNNITFSPGVGGVISQLSALNYSNGGSINLANGKFNQLGLALNTSGALDISSGATWVQECAALTASPLNNTGTLIAGKEVTIAIADASDATENDATDVTQSFTVGISPQNCMATTFSYATQDGSAVAPADYAPVVPASATNIPANTDNIVIGVPVHPDNLDEANENYTVQLSSLMSGVMAGDVEGQGVILDDDDMDAPIISIADLSNIVEGNSAEFVVTLSGPSGQNIVFDWAAGAGGDTATEGVDYTDGGQTNRTILAGDTSYTLPLIPVAVDGADAGEYFTVTLSNVTNVAGSGNDIVATATLIENGPKQIFRSVGFANFNCIARGTGGGCSIIGNMSISGGDTATFSSSIPDNIGVGDAIQYATSGTTIDAIAFIKERISSTSFKVQSVTGGPVTNRTAFSAWQIYRAYTSLTNAEDGAENTGLDATVRNFDAWSGGRDLVANNEEWNIAIYADDVENSQTIISGWVTDSTRKIRIYTPQNIAEVGISQRHNGEYSKYFAGFSAIAANPSLQIDANYITIEGLQFLNSGVSFGAFAIQANFNANGHLAINGNIFTKDSAFNGGGSSVAISLQDSGAAVPNFEISNNQFVLINGASCLNIVDGNAKVYNNNFLLCGSNSASRSIHHEQASSANIALYNNVFYDDVAGNALELLYGVSYSGNGNLFWKNPSPDYAMNNSGPRDLISDPNMSDPDHFDFRWRDGYSDGRRSGFDAPPVNTYNYQKDILSRNRIAAFWDRGPYQNTDATESFESDLLEIDVFSDDDRKFKLDAQMIGDLSATGISTVTLKYCHNPTMPYNCDPRAGALNYPVYQHGSDWKVQYESPDFGSTGMERIYHVVVEHQDPNNLNLRQYFRKVSILPAGTIQISERDVNFEVISDTEIKVSASHFNDSAPLANFIAKWCMGSSCDLNSTPNSQVMTAGQGGSKETTITGLNPGQIYSLRVEINDTGLLQPYKFDKVLQTFNFGYMSIQNIFAFDYFSSFAGGQITLRVPFTDPDFDSSSVMQVYMCESATYDCDPKYEGEFLGNINASGSFYLGTLNNLNSFGFLQNDNVVIAVYGDDPDGVASQGYRRSFRLEENTPKNITLYSQNIYDLNASQFTVDINYSGDVNGDANLILYICNDTDDGAGACDPLSGSSYPMLTRSDYNFSRTVMGLGAPWGSGDVVSARIVASDGDGTSNSPFNFSFTLGPPPVPPSPTNLSLTAINDSAIDVTWLSGGGNTFGYKLAYQVGSTPTNCNSGTTVPSSQIYGTTYRIEGLMSSMVYGVVVCSINNGSPVSESSTFISGTIATLSSPVQMPPVNPYWLNITPTGTNSISLNWMGDHGGDFRFAYVTGSVPPADCLSGTNFIVPDPNYDISSGLNPDTQYAFRICAVGGPPLFPLSGGLVGVGQTLPVPVKVSIAEAAAEEGQNLRFVVSMDKSTTQNINLSYTINFPFAANSSDLTGSLSENFSIVSGQTQYIIDVPTAFDGFGEGDEAFGITISENPPGPYAEIFINSAKGYIVEHDVNKWPKGVNGYVNAVAYDRTNDKTYLGGRFSGWDDTLNVGAVRIQTMMGPDFGEENFSFKIGRGFNNNISSWAVQPDGKILAAGAFTTYNGEAANRIVRLNADGSRDTSFNSQKGFNSTVSTISVLPDGKILVGGVFSFFDPSGANVAVNKLVRLHENGDYDNTFISGINATVSAIAVLPNGDIFAGGASPFLWRLDGIGTNLGLGITPNGTVNTIKFIEGNIYVGGAFTSPNGRIMKYDVYGNQQSFTTSLLNTVSNIEYGGPGKIMVGGLFVDACGYTNLDYLAKFNTDGTCDSTFQSNFSANLSTFVASIATDNGGNHYVTGGFAQNGGLVRVMPNGFLDSGFNNGNLGFIKTTETVGALLMHPDGSIFVGGTFKSYNGTPAGNIVRLNNGDSYDFSFNNSFNNEVFAMDIYSSGKLLVAGGFTQYNATTTYGLVRLDSSGAIDTAVPSASNNMINAVLIANPSSDASDIFIGGSFTLFNGVGRNRFAKLNSAFVINTSGSWNTATAADNAVFTIAQDSAGNVYAGGSFASFAGSGVNATRIVKLNSAGAKQSFGGTGTDLNVNALAVDSSDNLYVGGDFSAIDGISRNRIAKFNSSGVLQAFASGAGNGFDLSVKTLAIDTTGKIYVGGSFNTYNGVNRIGFALLDSGSFLDSMNLNLASGSVIKALKYHLPISGSNFISVGGDYFIDIPTPQRIHKNYVEVDVP